MSIPGFTSMESIYHSRNHYRANNQYARLGIDSAVQLAQRCSGLCYEANVACIPSPIPFVPGLLFNSCFCPSGGVFCPDPNPTHWWVAGVCIGAWETGCHQ